MSQPPVDPLIGYFNQAHQNSDVNEDVDSLHHTLGLAPTQAAPGNHGAHVFVGAIIQCGGATPIGWILCNGAAISRTTYAQLFKTIGVVYGAGDGVTTFNVPNIAGSPSFIIKI